MADPAPDDGTDVAPALRASYDRQFVSLNAYAERSAIDSLRRIDLSGRLAPLPWLALVGAVSRAEAASGVVAAGGGTVARAEVAGRIGDAWLSVGRVERGGGVFAPPRVYAVSNAVPVPYEEARAGGFVGSLRGRFYRDLHADVNAVVWDSAGSFRPRYQGRAELRLLTNWLSRFPTREFGANIAVFDEYRSEMSAVFATPSSTGAVVRELRRAPPGNQVGALIELRLQSAVISFQIRNALGRQLESVPGLALPRALTVYGVRWEFSN